MRKGRLLGILGGVFAACFVLGSVALLVLLSLTDQSVQEYSAAAQRAHPHLGDDVSALMEFAESREHTSEQRTRAVWALGRLGDPKALPVLEALRTGEPCDHSKAVCQYELEKAIENCGGTR